MKLVPRSLYGRLLAASTLATLAALAVAALAIGAVFERFVMQGLDQRLDAQIMLLAAAVRPDGGIDRNKIVVLPPADRHQRGGGWWIDTAGRFEIGSLPPEAIASLTAPDHPGRRPLRPHEEDDDQPVHPVPIDGHIGSHSFHGRRLSIETSAGPVTITAVAPRAIVDRPIRAAMAPLLGSLAMLGLALGVATLVQLRVGLHPLRRLRDSVRAVRAGTQARVPDDQPTELQPLAWELNALLHQNDAALTAARSLAANLAHGLKTPLATLALALREQGRDPDGALMAEVERIDRAVRHHLGRARTGAPGGTTRRRTLLGPAVDGVAEALGRIHEDRGINFDGSVAPGLELAIDRQDLDELLGNLLDNAWRWAKHQIVLTAEPGPAGQALIRIEDDGPGIPAGARTEALEPGRRLDERGDGHGFGLSIVRELIELYGGTLALDAAEGGGLSAIVTLPLAPPAGAS